MTDALPIIDLAAARAGAALAAGRGRDRRRLPRRRLLLCRQSRRQTGTLIAEAFAQSRAFFALPLADKRRLAIETVGGNRGYSGLLHEALDPARGPDMKEAFNIGLDLAPDDPELHGGQAVPLAQRLAGPAGVPRNAACLLRRLRGARRATASRIRPQPRP